MHSMLTFSPFKLEDWPEYLSRFEDPELAGQLGPMVENDPRLHQVLHADPNDNIDYSVFKWNEMVAEIGVWLPNQEHPYYVITNMAVKPDLRWQWLGRRILQEIMDIHSSPLTQLRKAYVNWNNLTTKKFFERNGWVCISTPPDNDDMFLMEYSNK